jgi:hypothetical protein
MMTSFEPNRRQRPTGWEEIQQPRAIKGTCASPSVEQNIDFAPPSETGHVGPTPTKPLKMKKTSISIAVAILVVALFVVAYRNFNKTKAGAVKVTGITAFTGDADTLAAVKVGGRFGFIDKTNKYAINPQFDEAEAFKEGLAVVTLGGKSGYIDKTGKYAINPQFDQASPFEDGLAMVKVGDKWGYIDTAGKYAINPKFDAALLFKDGLAVVKVGGKWGYIDKTGRYTINPQFDDAFPFSDGLAMVKVGDKWGHIDTAGKYSIKSITCERSGAHLDSPPAILPSHLPPCPRRPHHQRNLSRFASLRRCSRSRRLRRSRT